MQSRWWCRWRHDDSPPLDLLGCGSASLITSRSWPSCRENLYTNPPTAYDVIMSHHDLIRPQSLSLSLFFSYILVQFLQRRWRRWIGTDPSAWWRRADTKPPRRESYAQRTRAGMLRDAEAEWSQNASVEQTLIPMEREMRKKKEIRKMTFAWGNSPASASLFFSSPLVSPPLLRLLLFLRLSLLFSTLLPSHLLYFPLLLLLLFLSSLLFLLVSYFPTKKLLARFSVSIDHEVFRVYEHLAQCNQRTMCT